MTTPTPRPGILDIDPYVAGDSDAPGAARVIKLSSNECALGASPKAVAAFRAAGDHLYRYPDSAATELREAIAAENGLDAEKIVCGNGSDELLTLLAQAYTGPGDEVLFSEHGFLVYPIITRFAGAAPVVMAPSPNTRRSASRPATATSIRARRRSCVSKLRSSVGACMT